MNQPKVNDKAVSILYVDEYSEIIPTSTKILELLGNFQIDSFDTFPKAKKALENKRYNVIISGYCTNTKGSKEFLRELQSEGNKIPIIVFSVHQEIAKDVLKLGVAKVVSNAGDCEKIYTELANSIKALC